MTKPSLEMLDLGGIPLPGQYDDLKGIELWGDGKVIREDGKEKKKTRHVSSSVAAKVAEHSLQTPIFVENHQILPYEEFVGAYGNIIDEESYQIITEIYESSLDSSYDYEMAPYIYQFAESVSSNPFFTNWYPTILDAMKKPSSKTKIHELLTAFVEANSKPLSARYPTTNIMMNGSLVDNLLKVAGLTHDQTKEAVTELLSNMDAKTEFKSISKSPHQVIIAAMLIAATEIDNSKLSSDLLSFMAFSMYPLIFRKYFPVTDPNPQAMEEVVTTASKKFYIARTNSLLEWVRILASVPTDFYHDQFQRPNKTDKLIILYLNRLRNTMNQQFKSLYGVYKKAYDKRSIGKQADEDFITLGSNQDKVHIYTMGIVDRINGMRFNAKVCKAASEYTKCDPVQVAKYVQEYLRDTQEYGLKDYVSNILTIYFAVGQHNEFLSVAIRQYSRIFSSKDKIYNDFRKYLERIEKKFLDFDDTYLHRYLFGVYMYFAILTNIVMNQISNKFVDMNLAPSGSTEAKSDQKEEM